jgi:hypothetical protein
MIRETVTVYPEDHTNPINKNAQLTVKKKMVHVLTIGLLKLIAPLTLNLYIL